jgi:hypothetical protein
MVVKRVDRAKGGIADHRVPRELEPCRESTYITLAPTVERDLGKRRSAQRLPAFS